jgi:hypothetical protein
MTVKRRSLPDTSPLSDSEDESSSCHLFGPQHEKQQQQQQQHQEQKKHEQNAKTNTTGQTLVNTTIRLSRTMCLGLVLIGSVSSFMTGRLSFTSSIQQHQMQNSTATVERISLASPRLPLFHAECPSELHQSFTISSQLAARIQYFGELVIHPVLLAIEKPAVNVAMVLDQVKEQAEKALLGGLLHQLELHRSLQRVYLVVDEKDDCPSSRNHLQVTCVSQEQLDSNAVDVVFLLDDCNVLDDDYDNGEEKDGDLGFWKDRLSSDVGTLVTCAGETLPMDHPHAFKRFQDDREDMLLDRDQDDDDDDDVSLDSFDKVIEYDIRLTSTSRQQTFASTIAVAMKNATAMAQWRLNAAHYSRRMHKRMKDASSLQYFDSATMPTLQYPSKQAAVYSCQHYLQVTDNGIDSRQEEEDLDFAREWCLQDNPYYDVHGIANAHGYEPNTENVPITDLYMGKSTAGDHAGRGVFTKRDIPAEAYVGLETTVHSVLYEWTTTVLHNDMKDFVQEAQKAHIIYVYAEAYGFSQDPWNMPQEAVMTHLLTFTNHGCNGTANLGDLDDTATRWTEFNVDLESGLVPEDFKTTVDVAYLPSFDRDQSKHETMSRAGRLIGAGEELYDNYMSFGGDQYFAEMVETLRQECSGSLGMVEQYQRKEKVSMVVGAGKKVSSSSHHQHGKEERW